MTEQEKDEYIRLCDALINEIATEWKTTNSIHGYMGCHSRDCRTVAAGWGHPFSDLTNHGPECLYRKIMEMRKRAWTTP